MADRCTALHSAPSVRAAGAVRVRPPLLPSPQSGNMMNDPSSLDLAALLPAVSAIARAAGAAIRSVATADMDRVHKTDGSLVTAADHAKIGRAHV